MNNKTAGILISITGIALAIYGILALQGYFNDMRNFIILAIIDPSLSQVLILIVGIMIFGTPDIFWLLIYIGLGLSFFGALLCALD